MKTKIYLIILFSIIALCSRAQNIDDILERGGTTKPVTNPGEITLTVDTDIPPSKTPEELEKLEQIKKDSIEQINEKWKKYFLNKDAEFQKIYQEITQTDTNNITIEKIEDFETQITDLTKDFGKRQQTNDLWRNNDELDNMSIAFDANCTRALSELSRRKEKINASSQKSLTDNPLIIIGICLLAIMAIIPIFTQIKSAIMVKKTKKQQAQQVQQAQQQAQQQQQELERQMLLSDENNMITLKE